MATGKAFGVPISSAVHKQLEARKTILKSQERTVEQTMLLHNRGAWCRMVSGVNTKETPDAEEYTDKLASNFILQGGTLKSSQTETGKRQTKPREGLELMGNFLDESNQSSYGYDEISGFRPMVGIDSFQVATQGAYGTLKKANIGFRVWSLEHLDAMEQLYFRPGFNVLVEYGSGAYIDSSSNDLEVSTLETSLAQEYISKTKSLEELQLDIQRLEEETSFNYSAFLGRILNFSWSYNTDGGFDCSVQIQARGEVVESLKVLLPDNEKSRLKELVGDDASKSSEHTIVKALKALKIKGKLEEVEKRYMLDKNGTVDTDNPVIVTRSNGFNIEGLEQEAVGTDTKYEPGNSYENQFVFLNLGSLMSLCNNLLVPENEDGVKETFFRTKRYEEKLSSPFITFPGHVALDPGVCMLPKKTNAGVYLSDLEIYGGYANKGTTYPNELKDERLEYFNIYHILLNIDDIIDGINSLSKDGQDSSVNVFSFLKLTLSKITENLGGINEFDLDLNKEENEWRVVDRNYYNPELSSKETLSVLDLIGLGSLVTNFNLETKISGELTNMLAIAASVSNDDTNLDAMSRYNIGVTDRYKKVLETGPAEKSTKGETVNKQEEDNKVILDGGGKVSAVYALYSYSKKWDRVAINNVRANHKDFTEKAYKENQRFGRQKGKKLPFRGIIPLTINLTVDGISGLRIGEAFVIGNNVLPARYHNRVGFVISGLDDTIGGDNRWQTAITAYMFNLPASEKPDATYAASLEKLVKQKEVRRKEIKAVAQAQATKGQKNVKAMYGEPGDRANFATLVVPDGFNLTYDGKPVRKINGVHKKVSSQLRASFDGILAEYGSARIKELKINVYSGTYNKRAKRGGTTWSMHSWGIAIDLYYAKNKLRTKAPEAAFSRPEYKKMIDIFEQNGWYSLGRAKNYDYMHFQAWNPNQKE